MVCLCLKTTNPTLQRSFSLSPEYLQVSRHDPRTSSDSDFEFHPYSHPFMADAHEDDLETMSSMPTMWSPVNANGYEIESLKENRNRYAHQESSDLIHHNFPDSPPYISPLRPCDSGHGGGLYGHYAFPEPSHSASLKIAKLKIFIFGKLMKSKREGKPKQDLQPSPFCLSPSKTCSRCKRQFQIQVLPLSSSASLSKETRMLSSDTPRFRIRKQSAASSPLPSYSHAGQYPEFSNYTSATNIKHLIEDPGRPGINSKQPKTILQGGSRVPGRTRVCGSNLMPEKSLVSNSNSPTEMKKKGTPQRVSAENGCRGSEGSEAAEWNTLHRYYGIHYGHQSPRSQELARSKTTLQLHYRQIKLTLP